MSDVIVIIIGGGTKPPGQNSEDPTGDVDGFAQVRATPPGEQDVARRAATPYTIARDMLDEACRKGSRIRIIYEG